MRHEAIILRREERELLTLEGLASLAGLHPMLVEEFVELGLIDPVGRAGSLMLFEAAAVSRVRTIERLRRDMGVNLSGVGIILDLLDRLHALRVENDRLRSRA